MNENSSFTTNCVYMQLQQLQSLEKTLAEPRKNTGGLNKITTNHAYTLVLSNCLVFVSVITDIHKLCGGRGASTNEFKSAGCKVNMHSSCLSCNRHRGH